MFQDEEKINEIEANRNAKLEKEKKNLPYDESSKFLGTLDEKINKPWYIDVKESAPIKKYPIKKEIISKNDKDYYNIIKDFQVDSTKFYKRIDGSFIESKKDKSNTLLVSNKEENNKNHKEKNHHKKDKHKKSRSRSRVDSKEKERGCENDKQEKLAKLREERLKREAEEKKKVLQLLTKISG